MIKVSQLKLFLVISVLILGIISTGATVSADKGGNGSENKNKKSNHDLDKDSDDKKVKQNKEAKEKQKKDKKEKDDDEGAHSKKGKSDEAKKGKNIGKKIKICHIPPGNPDNAHTIKISKKALAKHLAHGDHTGRCTGNENGGGTGGTTDTSLKISNVSSTTANGAYTTGATIAVTVTFSQAVTVTGTPQLLLETGATDRQANYVSGSGTTTLTFNYVVQAGDASSDLDYVSTSSLTLNGGTIKNKVTNTINAILTLPAPGATGSLGANKNIIIGTISPTVTNVSSTTANGSYNAGNTISVTVTFSEAVVVTGTPQLVLETGATDRQANYVSGSGTSTLTFNYVVQTGDTSSDLDYVSTNSLSLNGGTIKDTTTNNAILTLPSPGTAGSLGANKNIVIGTTSPTVSNISSTTANGAYTTGATIAITVTFNEAVDVTGTPQLVLETGATDRQANYASGSGTSTLTFNYVVQAGDASADLDYVSTNSLSLNGGTIKDGALNNAILTLPTPGATGSLGANKNIIIDTVSPTVSNVSSTTANGAYTTGATIAVTVTFSQAVTVTGTP
ncbi:MAG TPA: hypothetical protein VD699_05390, partial [Nitrosopumilaceae archaeon]|nr:hypothetical protein [Nitrosopumilaceae archaeon]